MLNDKLKNINAETQRQLKIKNEKLKISTQRGKDAETIKN